MRRTCERVERARSIVIIKHKYTLVCNHKIGINIKSCLRNSTVRREIGQLAYSNYAAIYLIKNSTLFSIFKLREYACDFFKRVNKFVNCVSA